MRGEIVCRTQESMKKVKKLLVLFLFLLPATSFPAYFHQSTFLMGTVVEIKVQDKGKDVNTLKEVVKETFNFIKEKSLPFDIYSESSEINRINSLPPGKRWKLSPEFKEILEKSFIISQQTEGSFDITVLPLVELWGFYKTHLQTPPSREEIRKMKELVDYRNLELLPTGEIYKKKKGVRITLSGIAKGWIVDESIQFLHRKGIESALVNAGGDLRVYGKEWRIGVQDPRSPQSLLGVIKLYKGALATSGDYQKFWIYKGKRYHHILDPHTGYPASSGVISATVLSSFCYRADALATALVVKGEEGLKWIEKSKEEEAILVKEEKRFRRLIFSSGMRKYFGEVP